MLKRAVITPRRDLQDSMYELWAAKEGGVWKPYWEKDEARPIEEACHTDDALFGTAEEALRYAAKKVEAYFEGE